MMTLLVELIHMTEGQVKTEDYTGILCAKTQFQISYSMHKNSREAPNVYTALEHHAWCISYRCACRSFKYCLG